MQVMERFERENGGELVVATLCLLEVSVKFLQPILRGVHIFILESLRHGMTFSASN